VSDPRPIRRRLVAAALATVLLAALAGAAPIAALAAAPTAVADSTVVQRNAGPTAIDVLANDTVDAGDVISAIPVAAAHGTVEIAADGRRVTYEPDAGYSGPDAFDYTVTNDPDGDATATVTVKVNAPPVAVDDPAIPGCMSADYGGSFPIVEDAGQFVFGAGCSLNVNDTDADGSIVAWDVVTPPAHGTIEWLPSQPAFFGYTPDPDYNTPAGDQPGGSWESDSLTYQAIDDDGARSNPATLRIWMAPLNDAPTVTAGPATVHAMENTPYSASWATGIAAGPPNESAQTVHFQVTADSNPGLFSAGPSISTNGTLSFTPASNATGLATVSFVAKDDGGLEDYQVPNIHPADTSAPVTVQIVVDAVVPDPPDAVDDDAVVAEDASTTAIDVLANDVDHVGDGLSVTSVGAAAHGTVGFTAAGVTYKPAANANGSDTFTYTISDGHGGSATATVDVTITPVNDAPNAGADAATVVEDQGAATTITVLANDDDVDGDSLTITAAGGATRGAVSFTATGVGYKPNANAFGSDTVTYTVADGRGGTATGSIAITILPVNDNPNAVNDGVPTALAVYLGVGPQALPVLANDTWLPDAPETLRIVGRTNGGHGTVAITGGGTGLTYAPTGTSTGIDVFTYTLSDGHGGSDAASVQVNVVRDVTKPRTSAPAVSIHRASGKPTRLVVSWTITETQSGLAQEQLQMRTNGGAWVNVRLASSAVRTVTVSVAAHRTVQFRLRARDRAGNWSSFVLSRTVTS
jgi:large repetitive protein